jgi:hypothetical protein
VIRDDYADDNDNNKNNPIISVICSATTLAAVLLP